MLVVIRLKPDDAGNHVHLARALNQTGRSDRALDIVQHGLTVQADHRDLHLLQVELLHATGNQAAAYNTCSTALSLFPDNYRLLKSMMPLIGERGDSTTAMNWFRRSVLLRIRQQMGYRQTLFQAIEQVPSDHRLLLSKRVTAELVHLDSCQGIIKQVFRVAQKKSLIRSDYTVICVLTGTRIALKQFLLFNRKLILLISKNWVRSAPMSVLALLVLGACSSSNDRALYSQAIDGYIVSGAVSCDDESGGMTAIEGRFSCPKNTVLVSVIGGWDVGFDSTAETSHVVFVGELRAPANLGYVTPLSTVAVQMASTAKDGYQAALFGKKVIALGLALGDGALDLSKDPSDTVNSQSLIRFNAQIHQILSTFARSETEYASAIAAFATVISKNAQEGTTVGLQDNLTQILSAINEALPIDSPMHLTSSQIASSALTVAATNQIIDAAVSAGNPVTVAPEAATPDTTTPDTTTPDTTAPDTTAPDTTTPDTTVTDTVEEAAIDAAVARAAVTIDRSYQSVSLVSRNGNKVDISIDDFENSTLYSGSYRTQVNSGLVEVGYDNDVLQFNKDLVDVQVTMAFELKSTDSGDSRSLSFYSDEIRLSAVKGQSDSLVISVPDGAILHIVGVDSIGTMTTAEVEVVESNSFSNANGQFSVNYSSIEDELERLGFNSNLSNAKGNYEATLIISGIQLTEATDSGEVVPATGYDISVGDLLVGGAGFKGYISYLD